LSFSSLKKAIFYNLKMNIIRVVKIRVEFKYKK
jgi:hypothetical protein